MKRRDLMRAGVAAAAGVVGSSVLGNAGASTSAGASAQAQAETSGDKRAFAREAKKIYERHFAQTRDTAAALRRKYEKPVFGEVRIWDLIQKLALCVDASDTTLGCTNQLIHVQQILAGMERDGVRDPDLHLAALTHDLGKVLLLRGEAHENVVCTNKPIGEFARGVGLDRVVFQWNHDEFIYSRLRDHVPDHVAWLLRYHSIHVRESEPFMDDRDRLYVEKYLRPFSRYDMWTKSRWKLPPFDSLGKYRDLVEKTFPKPIAV